MIVPNNPAIPEPTIKRLPWYLSYVNTLAEQGIENVSSTQISKALSVDSSQIAKDLSFLNIKGKTRIGYSVVELLECLTSFLGFKREHKAVIIGVGNLGSALIQDKGLANFGLNIIAGFDTRKDLIGKEVYGVPIYDIAEIKERETELHACVGILTLPVDKAQDAADLLVDAGVKAIWNFTPRRILVPEGTIMKSTSIYAHLALMYNRLDALGAEEKK